MSSIHGKRSVNPGGGSNLQGMFTNRVDQILKRPITGRAWLKYLDDRNQTPKCLDRLEQ